jgi:hypothetical protein
MSPTRKEISYSDRRFWCSYIIFIIIIGGILLPYIYIIFSPSNKIHREVGRAKDLSAPRYCIGIFSITYVLQILASYVAHTVVTSDLYTTLQVILKRLIGSTYDANINFSVKKLQINLKYQVDQPQSNLNIISLFSRYLLGTMLIKKLLLRTPKSRYNFTSALFSTAGPEFQ